MATARATSRRFAVAIGAGSLALLSAAPSSARSPELAVRLAGETQTMFRPGEGCDGHDVPDVPLRAFRNEKGAIVAFALHYMNRPFRGRTFDALKLDCTVAYPSPGKADPAAWNAQNWIAGVWTRDGRSVAAIVHHEYHADRYGRCTVQANGLACWYNAILAARSTDGGGHFAQHAYPVIAAAPFRQEVDQRRHRGFFNPSNMASDGTHVYFFAAQTGWPGQKYGVCLFRSADPSKPRSWRAFDGRAFSIRYDDPYRKGLKQPAPCLPIEPFPAQVGAVVRHRTSGVWVAVVQAAKDDRYYPVSGFYYATSRNLLTWSAPRLLMTTKSLYDNPCGAGFLNSYPSIVDPAATGRNFDNTGAQAWLYWSSMRVEGCNHTGDRRLLRRAITIRRGVP